MHNRQGREDLYATAMVQLICNGYNPVEVVTEQLSSSAIEN